MQPLTFSGHSVYIHGRGCSWQNTVLVFKLLKTRWLFLPWTGEFPHFISARSPDRSAVISAICVLSKALITIDHQCTEIKVQLPEPWQRQQTCSHSSYSQESHENSLKCSCYLHFFRLCLIFRLGLLLLFSLLLLLVYLHLLKFREIQFHTLNKCRSLLQFLGWSLNTSNAL